MKTPTEIVNDAKAFVRSTATTVGAVAIGFSGFIAALLGLNIVPEQYKAKVVAAGAISGTITVACRQIYAWLDPKNPSFGRVKVDVDPGAHEPGDDLPGASELTPSEIEELTTVTEVAEPNMADDDFVPPPFPAGGQD
jgi:hypothetical protein